MSLNRDESTCIRYLMKAYRFRMSSIKDEVLGAKLMTLWYDGMIDICIYNRNLIQAYDYVLKREVLVKDFEAQIISEQAKILQDQNYTPNRADEHLRREVRLVSRLYVRTLESRLNHILVLALMDDYAGSQSVFEQMIADMQEDKLDGILEINSI